jgi:hypothetical protein
MTQFSIAKDRTPWPNSGRARPIPGCSASKSNSVDDVVDQSVGGCRTGLLSDVGPDVVEVQFGQSR